MSRVSERRRRRPAWWRRLAYALAAVVVFGVGLALGEALHDNPNTGGTQTIVRTLHPLPLAPAAAKTVTVTTSNP